MFFMFASIDGSSISFQFCIRFMYRVPSCHAWQKRARLEECLVSRPKYGYSEIDHILVKKCCNEEEKGALAEQLRATHQAASSVDAHKTAIANAVIARASAETSQQRALDGSVGCLVATTLAPAAFALAPIARAKGRKSLKLERFGQQLNVKIGAKLWRGRSSAVKKVGRRSVVKDKGIQEKVGVYLLVHSVPTRAVYKNGEKL